MAKRSPAVTDGELQAFAKAYVKSSRVIQESEDAFQSTQGSKDGQRILWDATYRIVETFQREGIDVTAYNRIIDFVNTNEDERTKLRQFIEEEEQKAG